jgi:hypothetical protein
MLQAQEVTSETCPSCVSDYNQAPGSRAAGPERSPAHKDGKLDLKLFDFIARPTPIRSATSGDFRN